jgi:cytosine deaminase
LNGVKALLALKQELRQHVILQVVAFAQEGFEKYPETAELLRQALDLGCDAVGGHTIVDQDGKAHIDTIFEIAKAYQVPCEFHTDESGKPEHFLLPYLAEKTMQEGFEGLVNAIHACSLATVDAQAAADTIRQVKDAGIRIIVAPTAISTRQLTRVKELLAASVPICIGSDNIGDFFNPLGSGNMLHVACLLTYVKRFFTDEELSQVFTMITSAGAETLGIHDSYELQEGHPANISIFDARNLREVLINMPGLQCVIRNGAIIYESDAAPLSKV